MSRQLVFAIFIVGLLVVACDRKTDPMVKFGTTASNVFFYYEDVAAAGEFYENVMGFRIAADYGFAKIVQVAPKSFITLVDEDKGMHKSSEPKTTALALLTNELDGWWDYMQTQDVEMRSTDFEVVAGRPHDGFVAVDPEGYFLEFERFNDHPENAQLMPILQDAPALYPEPGTSNVPPGLGFVGTVVWFYYKDMEGVQAFYETVMGFDLLVDQGWAKIYQIGPSGFFGLVDEKRGMHRFTEQKAVTLSLFTADIDGWYDYMSRHDRVAMRSKKIEVEDEYRAFIAYDPEGYYIEWDVFSDIPVNAPLMEMLAVP
jgi:predicted enzyme related to lactoylglutathione lyase